MANIGVQCVLDRSSRTRGRVAGAEASGMNELPFEGADDEAARNCKRFLYG